MGFPGAFEVSSNQSYPIGNNFVAAIKDVTCVLRAKNDIFKAFCNVSLHFKCPSA